MNVKATGKTDVGKKRQNNEDSYYLNVERGLFIVADGMGGHNAGEVASRMAVEIVREFLMKEELAEKKKEEIEKVLFESIASAHHQIREKAESDPSLYGMGTTIVVGLLAGNCFYLSHVGDSRAYLVRERKVSQLTEDHSVVNELIKAGMIEKKEARTHPMKHIITQALGTGDAINPSMWVDSPRKYDLFLLCTDGLTDMLEDEEMLAVVKTEKDLDRMAERLVEKANEKGGKDNITVLLIKFSD